MTVHETFAMPGQSGSRRSLSRHVLAIGVLAFVLVGGVGGWAATTELSSAIVAPGTVVVENNVKKIQHLSGGIVGELSVRERRRSSVGAPASVVMIAGGGVDEDAGEDWLLSRDDARRPSPLGRRMSGEVGDGEGLLG